MLKKISKKIEEIRNEPEHVRIRWVWTSVFVSMLVIVAIWIFSLGSLFQGDKNNTANFQTPDITKQLQDLNKQAPSLKDISGQVLNIENEGISKKENAVNERPATNSNQEELPQASGYSDLPQTATGQ